MEGPWIGPHAFSALKSGMDLIGSDVCFMSATSRHSKSCSEVQGDLWLPHLPEDPAQPSGKQVQVRLQYMWNRVSVRG